LTDGISFKKVADFSGLFLFSENSSCLRIAVRKFVKEKNNGINKSQ